MRQHYRAYEKSLPEWKLRKEILPMLAEAGLIMEEPDPNDKRKMLIYLTRESDIPDHLDK